MVDADEDDGETFEPEVEQAVDERQVEVEEEADGLGEGERKWSNEDHQPDLFTRHPLGLKLRLALELGIIRQRPDSHRPSIEDITPTCLREEEEQEDEAKTRQPHQLPYRPLPPFILCCKSSN